MGGDEIAQKLDNETVTAIEYLQGRSTLRCLDGFAFAEKKILRALTTTKGIRLALAKAYSWSGGSKFLIAGSIAFTMLIVAFIRKHFPGANLAGMKDLSAIAALSGLYANSVAQLFKLLIRKKKQNYANGLLLDLSKLPSLPVAETESENEKLAFAVNNATLCDTENRSILNRISFSVRRGEHIGLVGTTGAGKTTLINALIGDVLPSDGSILTNGIAPDRLTSRQMAALIGYLPQKQHMFNATVRENISLSDAISISDESLRKILHTIKLDADLARHCTPNDDPLNIRIAANGDNLSVGEMTKIGMARILVRDPDILLIDEFDSALDEESKKVISGVLNEIARTKH